MNTALSPSVPVPAVGAALREPVDALSAVFLGPTRWVEAVELAMLWSSTMTIMHRVNVSVELIMQVAAAEAEGADERGGTILHPGELAARASMDDRDVRRARGVPWRIVLGPTWPVIGERGE